jgi:hypothetical protein
MEHFAKWRREQERIRRDPDLTAQAAQRLADEAYEPLRRQMEEARAQYAEERAALRQKGRAACFGRAPASGDKLLAWRDAEDRASAITDREVCDQRMRRALDSGDDVLAKALAQHAHDRGWGNLVSVMAVPIELLSALSELERPRTGRGERTHDIFRWRLSG